MPKNIFKSDISQYLKNPNRQIIMKSPYLLDNSKGLKDKLSSINLTIKKKRRLQYALYLSNYLSRENRQTLKYLKKKRKYTNSIFNKGVSFKIRKQSYKLVTPKNRKKTLPSLNDCFKHVFVFKNFEEAEANNVKLGFYEDVIQKYKKELTSHKRPERKVVGRMIDYRKKNKILKSKSRRRPLRLTKRILHSTHIFNWFKSKYKPLLLSSFKYFRNSKVFKYKNTFYLPSYVKYSSDRLKYKFKYFNVFRTKRVIKLKLNKRHYKTLKNIKARRKLNTFRKFKNYYFARKLIKLLLIWLKKKRHKILKAHTVLHDKYLKFIKNVKSREEVRNLFERIGLIASSKKRLELLKRKRRILRFNNNKSKVIRSFIKKVSNNKTFKDRVLNNYKFVQDFKSKPWDQKVWIPKLNTNQVIY